MSFSQSTATVAWATMKSDEFSASGTRPLAHYWERPLEVVLAPVVIRSRLGADLRAAVHRVGAGSRKAPNATSRSAAVLALYEAEKCGVTPERVAASADGGIAMYFFGQETLAGGAHRKFAMLECLNDGSVSMLLRDRLAAGPELIEIASSADLTSAIRSAGDLISS